MPEIIVRPKTKPQLATPLKATCPDCGAPLKRYCEIGPGLAITEKAVYCSRCKNFKRRNIVFGREVFAIIADPRRVKAAPIKGET